VVVLDVSGSMGVDKMTKTAMSFVVIDRPHTDRLSIVSFNDKAKSGGRCNA
jgi:Mg-chelatase subunit ChlD